MPQNDQSLLPDNTMDTRQLMGADSDETGRNAPSGAAGGMGGTWVYGEPIPGYAGCTGGSCPAGASEIAYPGAAPAAGQGNGASAAPTPAQGELAPIPIQGMNGGERLGGISSAAAQSNRMKNPVSLASTHSPSNSAEAYNASLRSLLNRNVGYFIVATFLVGIQQTVTWQGILHTVGSDYIVIYQPNYERYVSGDLYSLKFVQFHNSKDIPYCAAAQNWQGQSGF